MANERVQRQINCLLDQAEEAFSQRNWPVVRDNAQDVLGLDRENQDALTFLAPAERALGASDLPEFSRSSGTDLAEQAERPTSFSNGRYQVKRFLGEGGKKMVYLAHDTLLDRDVAFALIKNEALDEASRTRNAGSPGHG